MEFLLEISYLVATVFFIICLKMLSSPETARKGNVIGGIGMAMAVVATMFLYKSPEGKTVGNYIWIIAAMAVGTVTGLLSAKKVKMTAMPQMVAIFNGMGGACSALIGLVEFPGSLDDPSKTVGLSAIFASIIVGSVTFSGSLIAYAKLNGNIKKDIRLPYYNVLNTLLIIVILGLMVCLLLHNIDNPPPWIYLLTVISLIYGVLFVFPIGGADMPVVIAWLNSLSGIAAMFAGYIYGNLGMIVCGILVGASGIILTVAMCNAMNRSLVNVFFTAFGGGGGRGSGSTITDKTVKEISMSDSAVLLYYSKSVVMVPGYGLAVAQAQHALHELETLLEKNGVDVTYAIHPVAGRMPGHMNVLLAEAKVEYDKLIEMDTINPRFPNTDVVIVVGANDVVNPAANTDPSSPIYGMPILEVNKAGKVIVIKRSMAAGYAGIENHLFYDTKTSMLFGDAKKVISGLAEEVKKF
ncbi:MAG: NAD(P)(+) transhydrogenase (Re/Si-specific) subunit beta [Bacteroidetes bacterium]|nr:NAD(P)(+) transhydrogenase (Re/Si-specific) subunit beta [Bacteroidota bacterium]